MAKFLPNLFLFTVLLLAGCAYKYTEYDLSHYQPYSFAHEENFEKVNNIEKPFIAYFETPKSKLVYVGSNHSTGMESELFQMIRSVVTNFKPEIIILEGFRTNEGISPRRLLKRIQSECLKDWKKCGEPLYGVHMALSNNINYIGAEPRKDFIDKVLLDHGYSKKDILFLHFSDHIPIAHREKRIKSRKDIRKIFINFISSPRVKEKHTYGEYENWLKENLGDLPYETLIDTNLAAPIEDGNYMQKMSHVETIARDFHVIKLILNYSQKYKKILFVMGGSHFCSQRGVFEQYLGRPTYYNTLTDYVKKYNF